MNDQPDTETDDDLLSEREDLATGYSDWTCTNQASPTHRVWKTVCACMHIFVHNQL